MYDVLILLIGVLRPMAHDPSSPIELLVPVPYSYQKLGSNRACSIQSKFLVHSRQIWYQNAWQILRVSGTRFWYQ